MSQQIHIAGVPINKVNYDQALDRINRMLEHEEKSYVVTANPEMVILANRDEVFMDVLKSAQLSTPDGIGIVWAAHFLNRVRRKNFLSRQLQLLGSLFCVLLMPYSVRNILEERVTGTDLMRHLVEESHDKGWKIFLLGASNGVAKQVINRLSDHFPKAQFVGSYAGSPALEEEEQIIELINQTDPDLLFVAYGNPEQEYWIRRNLFKMNNVRVAIGVGGAFDFHAGRVRRAPKLFRKLGLEWLWRLSREPKRLGRIWTATYHFVQLVYREKYPKH